MHPNIVGALVNSAIYLLCVFVAGLVTGHPAAWKLALIAMGVTYLSHIISMHALCTAKTLLRDIATATVVTSIAVGTTAGILLLF